MTDAEIAAAIARLRATIAEATEQAAELERQLIGRAAEAA